MADAVYSVTGCTLGKRRLKWMNYGKMAASFIDIPTRTGVRIVVNANQEVPEGEDIASFWQSVPDAELFKFETIEVDLKEEDLPGKPLASMVIVDEAWSWRVVKEGGKMKAFKQSGKMVCIRRQ